MFVNYTLAFVRKLCQESVLFMYIFTWRGSLSSLPGPHKRLGKPFLGHQRHPYRFLLLHLYPWSIPGLPQSQCLPRNCQQRFGQLHIFTAICNFMRWLIVQNIFFFAKKNICSYCPYLLPGILGKCRRTRSNLSSTDPTDDGTSIAEESPFWSEKIILVSFPVQTNGNFSWKLFFWYLSKTILTKAYLYQTLNGSHF